jgi:hypothetical protein
MTWQGADGLVYANRTGFHDAEHGPCSPLPASDGVRRCLPPLTFTMFYTDDACSLAIGATVLTCGAPLPTLGIVATADACAVAYDVRPIIGPTMPPAVWAIDGDGACVPGVVFQAPWIYFTLGTAIQPSEFVALDSTTDP